MLIVSLVGFAPDHMLDARRPNAGDWMPAFLLPQSHSGLNRKHRSPSRYKEAVPVHSILALAPHSDAPQILLIVIWDADVIVLVIVQEIGGEAERSVYIHSRRHTFAGKSYESIGAYAASRLFMCVITLDFRIVFFNIPHCDG